MPANPDPELYRERQFRKLRTIHANLARLGAKPLIDMLAAEALDNDQLTRAVAISGQQLLDVTAALENSLRTRRR